MSVKKNGGCVRGCGGTLLLVCAMFAGLLILLARSRPSNETGYADRPAATPAPRKAVDVGSEGKLKLPGGSGVWVCLDESSWDEMLSAENKGAAGGPGAGAAIYRLAEARKIRKYPNGTKVRVLHARIFSRQVEVIDGPDRGDTGWVQAEFVSAP